MEFLVQMEWNGIRSIPFRIFLFFPFFMDKEMLRVLVESKDSKHKKALFNFYLQLFQEKGFSNAFFSNWISKDLGTTVNIETVKYIKRHFVKKSSLSVSNLNVIKNNFKVQTQVQENSLSDAPFDFRIKLPEPNKFN